MTLIRLTLSLLLLSSLSLSAQQLTYGWSVGGQGVFNRMTEPLPEEENATQFGLNGRLTANIELGKRMAFGFGLQAALINYGQQTTETRLPGQDTSFMREIESRGQVFYVGVPLSLRYFAGTDRNGLYLRSGLQVLAPLSVRTTASVLRFNPQTGKVDRDPWPAGRVKTQVPTVIGEFGLGFQLPSGRAFFELTAGYTLTTALRKEGGTTLEGIPNYLASNRAWLVGLSFGSYFGRNNTNDE